jgi:four helix bundle protein
VYLVITFCWKTDKAKKTIMKTYDVKTFNQKMRTRTKAFAVSVYTMLKGIRLDDLNRVVIRQLMKSASSVAANYSSATRGRSEAEYYSKLCIVVEECDETIFWLDFLVEVGVMTCNQAKDLQSEAEELLKIFSTIKKKLKIKRTPVN